MHVSPYVLLCIQPRPLSSETLPPPFVCVFPDKHLTRINPASKWMLPKDYDALMASCRLVSRGTSISCIGPGFSIHAGRKNRHWHTNRKIVVTFSIIGPLLWPINHLARDLSSPYLYRVLPRHFPPGAKNLLSHPSQANYGGS